MKADVNVDVTENVKQLINDVSNIQKNKFEYMEKTASTDDDKLCFRICTASGTRINVPSNILKDMLIAGTIFASTKIVVDLISVLMSKSK